MDEDLKTEIPHYVTRVLHRPSDVLSHVWDTLLDAQAGGAHSGPFMRHAYLHALHSSGSSAEETGWACHWLTLWQDDVLCAACPLYVKNHSYGEYVFDWAWAQAYAEHGLNYYPKGLVAVPFTPVPGPRLLARTSADRVALLQALTDYATQQAWSSVHVLFGAPAEQLAWPDAGLSTRQTVQFHWHNCDPHTGLPYASFDALLASMTQDKRKKMRQERRKVRDAGVTFRIVRGTEITSEDWTFFYRCYAQTYIEHGNAPYLTPAFFEAMARDLPDYWLLVQALSPTGEPIACSLLGLSDTSASPQAAYGRYWGALQQVDCLHFETCYYQTLEWCIAHGVQRFEGGAQGEHKMARALLPTATHSGHWLAHPAFQGAVDRYLARETTGVSQYLDHLKTRSPLKDPPQERTEG